MTKPELIALLQATRDRTLSCFALDEVALDRTYGPGKWSVRRILHHLADAEAVLYQRLCRVISGETSVKGFEQDAWCEALDYDHLPLEPKRAAFAAIRELNIGLVGRHFDSKGHLAFTHSTYGARTLQQEMEKVALHNQGHLQQIEQALSGA